MIDYYMRCNCGKTKVHFTNRNDLDNKYKSTITKICKNCGGNVDRVFVNLGGKHNMTIAYKPK